MFFYDENFTICRICGESNIVHNRNCQNCRSRLNNRRNIFFDNWLHRNSSLINALDEDSDYNYNKHIIEKLEVKIMAFDLCGKDKNGASEPRICCICQDNIEVGQSIYFLSCTHCFHRNCANKWFEKKSECPYCRKKYVFYK